MKPTQETFLFAFLFVHGSAAACWAAQRGRHALPSAGIPSPMLPLSDLNRHPLFSFISAPMSFHFSSPFVPTSASINADDRAALCIVAM